jgi:hypothetical protein
VQAVRDLHLNQATRENFLRFAAQSGVEYLNRDVDEEAMKTRKQQLTT